MTLEPVDSTWKLFRDCSPMGQRLGEQGSGRDDIDLQNLGALTDDDLNTLIAAIDAREGFRG